MNRILALLAISTAALVSACASDGEPTYAWSYQQVEGEGEKLAYGAPNSDDVLLMMTCAPGSGQVTLSALTEEAQSDIVLVSGDGQDRFTGAPAPSELGGAIVEAQARTRATTLSHFAESGDLTLLAGGERVSLKADGAQKAEIGRFFTACA